MTRCDILTGEFLHAEHRATEGLSRRHLSWQDFETGLRSAVRFIRAWFKLFWRSRSNFQPVKRRHRQPAVPASTTIRGVTWGWKDSLLKRRWYAKVLRSERMISLG
jgi:hypothetical protein